MGHPACHPRSIYRPSVCTCSFGQRPSPRALPELKPWPAPIHRLKPIKKNLYAQWAERSVPYPCQKSVDGFLLICLFISYFWVGVCHYLLMLAFWSSSTPTQKLCPWPHHELHRCCIGQIMSCIRQTMSGKFVQIIALAFFRYVYSFSDIDKYRRNILPSLLF